MHIIFSIFFFISALASAKELKFEKVIFNRDNAEISGLVRKENDLLFVADKLSNRSIYKVRYENDRFFYQNYIDLSKLQGHDGYFTKALLFKHGGRIVKSPFDLEGITYCKDFFYIANEQTRHILKVNSTKLEHLNIPFEKTFKDFGFPLEKIETNAGFEGIAIDCENNVLYIAQERSPRAIIVVDLNKLEVTDIFDTTNTIGNEKNLDYADLYFEKGYLYILQRNSYLITKIDVKTKTIISELSYGETGKLHLRDFYSTGKPFGLAEGLTMDKDRIYIAIDNNNNPLTEKAQNAFGVKGDFSSILVYSRPSDF